MRIVLVEAVTVPFSVSSNAVSFGTTEVFPYLSPISSQQRPDSTADHGDSSQSPPFSSIPPDPVQVVSSDVIALTPRDLHLPNFPQVHRASFSFEPELIVDIVVQPSQRRFVGSGVDLYIKYAKAQRGLMPLVKISLFVIGSEAWAAYKDPVGKSAIIAKVSNHFDNPSRKSQLTLASNMLKRAIRFFGVVSTIGTDYLFDRALSVNSVIGLKNADIDDFVKTFTAPTFHYLEQLSDLLRRSVHADLFRSAMALAGELRRSRIQ